MLQGVNIGKKQRQCRSVPWQKGQASALTQSDFTNAARYSPAPQERQVDSASTETDVETLAFIRRVQRLGFTLKEIRDLRADPEIRAGLGKRCG
jgi:MerR, DNA binding